MLPAPVEDQTEPRGRAADDLGALGARARRAEKDYVFGAVYEHCDSTGAPRLVASTSMTPEDAFIEDGRRHTGVAALLTRGRGSSHVVWAGVGRRSAGVAEGEMAYMRQAVVDARATRLSAQKLSSIV